jgi:outer membrane protein TolC
MNDRIAEQGDTMALGGRFVLRGLATAALILICTNCPCVRAQTTTETKIRTLTLEEAVDFALKNYPSVRAAMEGVAAADAGVGLARTNYLPRADMLWQGNRATRNNIFGLLLPNSTVPSMSGPVLPTTSGEGAWGSAAGLLFSWEPLDFGRRRAEMEAARSASNRVRAEAGVTRLDVAMGTVNAYLTLLAAEQTVQAAQADVERRQVLAKSIGVLVDNQLRPGADGSRARAELARANAGLARARQQQEISRAALADILGIADGSVEVQEGRLTTAPPQSEPGANGVAGHPIAQAQEARVQEVRSEVHVLERSYYPKFNFQSALYGRGSGANVDGTFGGGTSGLGIDRSNWALGLTVTFPLFDIFSIRERKAIQAANERAEAALYGQAIQDLTGQLRKAEASLEGARQVAVATPVELEAARDTERQERARYQAGLATIVDVAEAQSLLVQAEIDDALARLAVWQNLAAVAGAHGDLQPFLQQVHTKAAEEK